MDANTLFLRLEGPMQAWGVQESKFVVRRTAEATTKSGIIGMLCAAMGISRYDVSEWLPKLTTLQIGVRIDRPGIRWWDYHTIGAGMQMRTAEGKTKPGAMLTRREYLCDASFLVAINGESDLIRILDNAIRNPKWTLYLGRKCCPPSRPISEHAAGNFENLETAVRSIAWRPRLDRDECPKTVDCMLDWKPTPEQPIAPDDALIWYDVPDSFEPPSHHPRFVMRKTMSVGKDKDISIGPPLQNSTPAPLRPRADYTNTEYKKRRKERLETDHELCVFCKSPATTVQHVTYRRAGGNESQEDLRSLCRLCHDAVTMIEYGMGMGLDRINPEEPQWRKRIIEKRKEIIEFRSLKTRRRRLAAEEVE